MKILVTGGSGFIGCNVVPYFQDKGWEVLNLSEVPPRDSSKKSLWRKCDILDRTKVFAYFKEFDPDYVIHLAARTDLSGNTLTDYSVNIVGTQNVVDAVNSNPGIKRAMYASSRLVFKIDHKPAHVLDYKPSTPYGSSKIEMEKIVLAQPEDAVPWLMFRPTSIWGEWFGVPYIDFFLSVVKGRYMHPAGRKINKSFGYVGNTVFMLDKFLEAPIEDFNRKIYFASDYKPVEVFEWSTIIRTQLGLPPVKTAPIWLLSAAGKVGDFAQTLGMKHAPLTSFRLANLLTNMEYDLTEEARICGPLPFSAEQGVERTLAWMKQAKILA